MIYKRIKAFFDYSDAYPTCSRTHATLCIYLPDSYNPTELAERFGIQPSRTQIKGEVDKGKVRNWPTAWFLETTEKVQSKEVRRHIDWLLDLFGEKSEIFEQLQDAGSVIFISCFWESAKGHGGPILDPTILKRISALNIGIAFDIYFDDLENETHNIEESLSE